MTKPEAADMNGSFHLQGDKNLLRISLAGNRDKPLLSLYGTEWRERGYGHRENLPFSKQSEPCLFNILERSKRSRFCLFNKFV